jgi:hypothetical protein
VDILKLVIVQTQTPGVVLWHLKRNSTIFSKSAMNRLEALLIWLQKDEDLLLEDGCMRVLKTS